MDALTRLSADLSHRVICEVLAEISKGRDVREAIDAVCGCGAYETIVGNLYDQLRARAVANGETVVPA